MLRVLDLFSGIGGFSLGLERTGGFRTVAFCEIDGYCQAVLRKHWPGVPVHADIRTFMPPSTDVICGGFPCQPVSVAGRRMGREDNRWLWPEMRRVIQESDATWIIGENVAGLDGMGLDEAIDDLEALSYEVAPPLEIPACAVGADHERNRIWIIAYAGGKGRQGSKQDNGLPFSASAPLAKYVYRIADSWEELARDQLALRGRNGVSVQMERNRLKAIGNSVVPQVVEVIGRAILEAECTART